MELDEKEKIEPRPASQRGERDDGEEEEKYKSFFEIDEPEDWEEDLEEEEVREKIREHKLKSLKERKRTGEKGEVGQKRFHRKR